MPNFLLNDIRYGRTNLIGSDKQTDDIADKQFENKEEETPYNPFTGENSKGPSDILNQEPYAADRTQDGNAHHNIYSEITAEVVRAEQQGSQNDV